MATSLIQIHHKDNAFFFSAIFCVQISPLKPHVWSFFFKIFNQFGLAEFDSNPFGWRFREENVFSIFLKLQVHDKKPTWFFKTETVGDQSGQISIFPKPFFFGILGKFPY